ncbi:MAG: DNA alkylation repair protein [Vicinamibacteria bacterium]
MRQNRRLESASRRRAIRRARPKPPPAEAVAPAGVDDLVSRLRSLRNPANVEGMRRFGLVTRYEQLGIGVGELRSIGRPHRHDHALARALWDTKISEAMVLAAVIDDPRLVSRSQMERWAADCDNWGLTDALCCGLFDRTPHAEQKAHEWSARSSEFVKRCGFALMAGMAVHREDLGDDVFLRFLPVIAREASDDRNFVKKGVSWALRQIGKRNPRLRKAAIAEARRIGALDSPAARWIAADALRELVVRKKPRTKEPAE